MDVICGGPVGLGGRGGREVQVSFYVVVQFSAVLLLRTMFHRPLPILTNVILEVEDDFHIFTCVRAGLYIGLVSSSGDNELTFLSAVETLVSCEKLTTCDM